MKMKIKASEALPWAETCLSLAEAAEINADAVHKAACEARILAIQSNGRWTLCGRIPHTLEKAEEIFHARYSKEAGYFQRESFSLRGTMKHARKVRIVRDNLAAAGDRKVILEAEEMALLIPHMGA